MQVIQCAACAGSVAYDAKREVAACLFCGSVAVHPETLAEQIRTPDTMLAFEVKRERAEQAFREWARGSWWYPKELRNLSVVLNDALLPAWRFDARIETHWAGLTRALTRSGLRPVSGVARTQLPIMVPASMGLSVREIAALEPFELSAAKPWRDLNSAVPFELPSVTETGARERARTLLSARHRDSLAREHRLQRCLGSSLIEVDTTRLLMLPIWIGSFRYRGLPWRLVINAQTGRVTGRAPLDRLKVGLAIAAAVLVGLVLAWWRAGQ